jgi:transcriptional regulator with XRE-family HTH domain
MSYNALSWAVQVLTAVSAERPDCDTGAGGPRRAGARVVNENRLGEYLRGRRELLQPEHVGIVRQPGRRVPGLRREEVAALAGISPDYYLRIEQGRDTRPSDQVVRALASALQLDEAAGEYLRRLSRPRAALRAVPRSLTVDDDVRSLLSQWTHTPAYVTDANQDVLMANAMARVFAPDALIPGANMVESAFENFVSSMASLPADLDPGERERMNSEWLATLGELIAAMRFNSDPEDERLREIVGRLSSRHRVFRRLWSEYEAKPQTAGIKRAWVSPLGWVDFRWQTLELPGPPRHYLTTFFGEAGSQAAAAIAFLAAQVHPSRTPVSAIPDLTLPAAVVGMAQAEARAEAAS